MLTEHINNLQPKAAAYLRMYFKTSNNKHSGLRILSFNASTGESTR